MTADTDGHFVSHLGYRLSDKPLLELEWEFDESIYI